MNKEIKQKWIKALRSGRYTQGKLSLREKNYYAKPGKPGKPSFCCLGVLCEVAIKEGVIKDPKKYDIYDMTYLYPGINRDQLLPSKVADWAGLNSVNPTVESPLGTITSLAELNDGGYNFNEIAGIIEAQL